MSEVKLFRLSGSALAIDMRTGHNATLRPGLVVLSEDAHTHAIEALAAECERVRAANLDCVDHFNQAMEARDAALAELAALKGGQEAVSKLQWPEIVGLVNGVLGCEAHKFPCSRGSIGHEMTGINFNSLARIIDRVRHSYPAPPAQASAWPEGWKLVPVEPTESMMRVARGMTRQEEETIGCEYRKLVAAAPTPGASDGKGGES